MNIKLLAIDLDGTLLDRASRVPEENRRAVGDALDAGVEVMLVTGRSWRSTKPIYDELGLAVTACVATDQAVAGGLLPAEGLVAADLAYASCKAEDFNGWEDWNPYTELDPLLSRCQSPPIMAAVYGDRSARRALAAFPDGLPASQFDLSDRIAGETVLHVWHEAVDKGRALAAYCRERGIRPDEVLAIGDAPMDLTMLRFAGIGVAVPDGHEPVKAAADWVATPAEAIGRVLSARLA